ncbi:MAG: sulfurtransferase complex subunit TusC [Halioglobus sp.]|nr:sulfurtransferase complex subunit TusC [Halioglobus sp.]
MTAVTKKTVLIVLRHSPYGSGLAKAALDTALASAAFEQSFDLLFMGDGVLQLHPGQDSRVKGFKNLGRQLASLPLYEINHVYVETQALARYNIDVSKSPVHIQQLNGSEIRQLMTCYDHLMGF